jgi:hypothetical protein
MKMTVTMAAAFMAFWVFDNAFNFVFHHLIENWATGNFMFTQWGQGGFPLETFTDIGKSVWAVELLGGWFTFNPIYILLTFLLGTAIVFLFYPIYRLFKKWFHQIRIQYQPDVVPATA